MRVRPFYLRIRSVGAAGDDELPSRANGLQARQGVQDFLRGMRKDVLRFQPFSVKSRLSHSLTAGSPRAPPALAAQLRAFSVIPSSLRAELSTSRNHSVGKVSAEPIFLLIVRIRSLYVSRTGTDSITLTLHCVRTRPAGKEVRLRLVLLDALFILSGSVATSFPTHPPRASGDASL